MLARRPLDYQGPEFVILRQLLKPSGDLHDRRHLAAGLMPEALTQDLTSVAITPERCSHARELSPVCRAQPHGRAEQAGRRLP